MYKPNKILFLKEADGIPKIVDAERIGYEIAELCRFDSGKSDLTEEMARDFMKQTVELWNNNSKK